MKNRPILCIIGSINMDLTISVSEMPDQGETVLGKDLAYHPGGKGANQAVAASRLGADVYMIGSVGQDETGASLLKHLEEQGISTDGVRKDDKKRTGMAHIILSNKDNRIIVSQGANQLVDEPLIDQNISLIKNSDLILLQLEIPIEVVVYTIKMAKKFNVPVILNPAPYHEIPDDVLTMIDYFTPNEVEMEELKSSSVFEQIKDKIIVTQGALGVEFFTENEIVHIPSFKVEVKDTTGAGDTFIGALATEIARGEELTNAVRFANAAAGLSVTKMGAQAGMPNREEVESFLKENHNII